MTVKKIVTLVCLVRCLAFGSEGIAGTHEAEERSAASPSATAPSLSGRSSPPDQKPAEVQKLSDHLNRRLPDWLNLSAEFRLRTEGRTGLGPTGGVDDAYLLSRIRINIEVHPTPWLQLFVQGQDGECTPLYAESETRFFVPESDYRFVFIVGEAGQVIGVSIEIQELALTPAKRVD